MARSSGSPSGRSGRPSASQNGHSPPQQAAEPAQPAAVRLAAPVTGAGTSPASAHPSSSAPVEAIARRAFELYEREGRHDGRDLEYWLRAEAELGGRSQA